MIGVRMYLFDVVLNPCQHSFGEMEIPWNFAVAGAGPRPHTQISPWRLFDCFIDFGRIEPAYEVRGLVDGIGQPEKCSAVIEVLAAHCNDEIYARVRRIEVVEHAIYQRGAL